MKLVRTVSSLRAMVKELPGRVALVPTMGNLHEGHLTLVRAARKRADHVVVSIFVNPLQFSSGEDIDTYPRTLQRDIELLEAEETDLVFVPEVADIYPGDMSVHTRIEVPGISDLLCGASRPGHFVGVATVVCKLFNMVQPDMALFGNKDYQQLMVIRRMVKDLSIPVQVIGVDTVRAEDGLAMSSRNGYLDEQERLQAPAIYQTMQLVADKLRSGERDFAELELFAKERITARGLRPDYFSIRRAVDLELPTAEEEKLVILVAAYLGSARLIDNLEVNLQIT